MPLVTPDSETAARLPGLADFDDNMDVIRPGNGLNKTAAAYFL